MYFVLAALLAAPAFGKEPVAPFPAKSAMPDAAPLPEPASASCLSHLKRRAPSGELVEMTKYPESCVDFLSGGPSADELKTYCANGQTMQPAGRPCPLEHVLKNCQRTVGDKHLVLRWYAFPYAGQNPSARQYNDKILETKCDSEPWFPFAGVLGNSAAEVLKIAPARPAPPSAKGSCKIWQRDTGSPDKPDSCYDLTGEKVGVDDIAKICSNITGDDEASSTSTLPCPLAGVILSCVHTRQGGLTIMRRYSAVHPEKDKEARAHNQELLDAGCQEMWSPYP